MRRPRIPTKIRIMGEDVRVTITTKLESDVNGKSDPEKRTIYINKNMLKDKRFQVLCHEILHYCNALLGYQKKPCDSETYVEQLSGLLNQIIPQL